MQDKLQQSVGESGTPAPVVNLESGFQIYDLHLAPTEAPARQTTHHSIILHCGPSVALEWFQGRHVSRKTFHAGDVSIHPAGDLPGFRLRDRARILEMSLSPDFIANVLPTTAAPDRLPEVYGIRDPQVLHIGLALQAHLAGGNPDTGLFTHGLATALAAHLFSFRQAAPTLKGLSPADRARVRDYIRAHLCDDLSVIALAALTVYSPHHFGLLFKQSFGVSPHQFVVGERIDAARHLLTSGDASLSQVARQVGFANQSHFHLHFKRLVGITPRRYRFNIGL